MNLIGTLNYAGEKLSVCRATYPESGTTAVVVENELGMRYCTVSVYVENLNLPPEEFVVTHNLGKELQAALLETGMFEKTDKLVSYGYVKDQPVWRLKGQIA